MEAARVQIPPPLFIKLKKKKIININILKKNCFFFFFLHLKKNCFLFAYNVH